MKALNIDKIPVYKLGETDFDYIEIMYFVKSLKNPDYKFLQKRGGIFLKYDYILIDYGHDNIYSLAIRYELKILLRK